MASIAEIIAHENKNTSSIHLHKEGLFWKAYQQSAYRIDLMPGCAYKLTKRLIKVVNSEVVSLGFPSLNITKHFREEQIIYLDDTHICINDKAIDLADYTEWFADIPLSVANPPKPQPKHQPITEEYITKVHLFEPVADMHLSPSMGDAIMHKLRNFRIEQATPMQCMLFLSQLQKDLP